MSVQLSWANETVPEVVARKVTAELVLPAPVKEPLEGLAAAATMRKVLAVPVFGATSDAVGALRLVTVDDLGLP